MPARQLPRVSRGRPRMDGRTRNSKDNGRAVRVDPRREILGGYRAVVALPIGE